MNIDEYYYSKNEKPLDRITPDGGMCAIFRKIACIGDSLSSGEMESATESGGKGYHDYFEYSWGQFMARDIGAEVLNFSKGGLTAKDYNETFGYDCNNWLDEKACQAYIIALGVNDIAQTGNELGSIDDVDIDDWTKNKQTFAGYYAQIIQRYKIIQPKAKFFLMTIPRASKEKRAVERDRHAELMYDMAELFDYTYVLDFRKYAPVYDEKFENAFYLGGHLNAAGYRLTAKMVESYIDYIIRHNYEDFAQVAFIGKKYFNINAKW